MNTNLPTTDMNIEDYEDQAIKKSKLAKGIGIAAAGAIGGGAIAAGTTYAATLGGDDPIDVPLNADEMAIGAEVGEEIAPVAEEPAQPATQPTTQYVYIEKAAPEHNSETEKSSDLVWEETTNYYVDGEKVMSIEEGQLDGHNFMLIDSNADGSADVLAYDVNNNHIYEENEVVELSRFDNIRMGNPTAHVSDIHHDPYIFPEEQILGPYAYNEEPHQIHNNFEDEKTGEDYHGDFAENNPDYNPNANMDYGQGEQYLAENYGYDGGDSGNYHAGLNEVEMEDNVASQPDMADASDMSNDSFDSMMESEEFLG